MYVEKNCTYMTELSFVQGDAEDVIELRVEDDFDDDDGGQMSHGHAKSVHSRLQPAESVFEEDMENQYEESSMSKSHPQHLLTL